MQEKVTYGQKEIRDFLEELATASPPLPAGGCAVALTGALSAALEYFVTQTGLPEILSRLEDLQNKCVEMMDRDVQEYERVMEALNMQTTTQKEQATRENAFQEAKIGALGPPMTLIESGLKILRYSHVLIEEGYHVALADAAVAVEMANACLCGSFWIARANLLGISNAEWVAQQRKIVERLETEGDDLYRKARDELKKRL